MTVKVPGYVDMMGKPFRYHGRGPDSYDCWGVVVELYLRAGLWLPEQRSSTDPATQAADIAWRAAECFERVDNPEVMDVCLFQVIPRFVTHCGVYVGNGYFLHITEKTSVAKEEIDGPMWANKFRGYYRIAGAR